MEKLKTYLVNRAGNVTDAIVNQLAAESIINHYLRTAPLPEIMEHWAEANGADLSDEWLDKVSDFQAAVKFKELF